MLTPTLFALVTDVALQVIQLYLQLVVDSLSPGALATIDDKDDDDNDEQKPSPSSNACDGFRGEAEGLRNVILHPAHFVTHVVDLDLKKCKSYQRYIVYHYYE
jgi:hypothetical protein